MSLYKGNNLISGHNILYSTTGQNTDGAMTQTATTTELNGKANTNLSNLSSTGQKVIDGQWVNANNFAIVSGAVNIGLYSIDLSNALPNDGYVYECIFTCDCQTGSTSGSQADVRMGSTLTTSVWITKTMARTANYVTGGGTAIVIVGTDRTCTYQIVGSNLANLRLVLASYRRIGTNS